MIRRVVAAAGATLLVAAPASAQEIGPLELFAADPNDVLAAREMPLAISGELTVEFRGDPAAGCAVTGVCGIEGAVTWTPARQGELYVAKLARRRLVVALQPDDMSRASAQVTRRHADGSVRRCSDVRLAESAAVAGTRPNRGLQITLPGTTPLSAFTDALTTRCAGPLQTDLAGALPAARLDPAALRRGRATLDLGGRRPFSGHGFVGAAHSTIAVRIGRAKRQRTRERGNGSRVRTMTVRYAIESVDGALTTTFAGSADPALCAPLDACGASGTVTAVPSPSPAGAATITAVAEGRRPWRDLRAALGLSRRGRSNGVQLLGSATWEGGTAAANVRVDGAPPCTDRVELSAGILTLTGQRGRVGFDYANLPDVLRTRCPGPRGLDIASERGAWVAAGTIGARALGARRPILRLTRGTSFDVDGYAGRTEADLRIRLRRTSVRRDSFVS